MSDREVWQYFVTRDSLGGALSATCSLWSEKPVRVKHRYRVTWVACDIRNTGYCGEYTPERVVELFGVRPDTDLELVCVEQYARENGEAYDR